MCASCCPREDESEAVGPEGDRANLIPGEVGPDRSNPWETQDSDVEDSHLPNGSLGDSYGVVVGSKYSTSLPRTRHNDEQAALQDVVTKMAGDVIDVNMSHATQTMEPVDTQERAHEYGRRLQLVAGKLALKYAEEAKRSTNGGLAEVANPERLLTSEVLSSNDTLLIQEVASRAQEAAADFQVQHVPTLVGIFGQTETIYGGSANDSLNKDPNSALSNAELTSEEEEDEE